MKECRKCEITKSLSEFHTDNRAVDGKAPWCKSCRGIVGRSDTVKISQAKADLKQILKYPEKYCANRAAGAARRAGIIKSKSCKCGSEIVQAHHNSYKKKNWLKVKWLCKICHTAWHDLRVYNPKTKGFDKL